MIPYILHSAFTGVLTIIYYETFGRLIYGLTIEDIINIRRNSTPTEFLSLITPTLPGLYVFMSVISVIILPIVFYLIIKYSGFYKKIPIGSSFLDRKN